MCKSIDKNVVTRDSQEPDPIFLIGTVVQYLLNQCLWWFYRTLLQIRIDYIYTNLRVIFNIAKYFKDGPSTVTDTAQLKASRTTSENPMIGKTICVWPHWEIHCTRIHCIHPEDLNS